MLFIIYDASHDEVRYHDDDDSRISIEMNEWMNHYNTITIRSYNNEQQVVHPYPHIHM